MFPILLKRCFFLSIILTFSPLCAFSSHEAASVVAQHDVQAIRLYHQLKNKYIKKTDPLIIAWGDNLSFYHRQKWQEYSISSPTYQNLKGISHVTLAIFALFHPMNQFPKNIAEVKNYQTLISTMSKIINALPLSSVQKRRQARILNLTTELLQNAIGHKTMPFSSVEHFFNSISPLIMTNIHEAAISEIDLLNQQMTKIQHQLSPEDLSRLFVVIPVSKMPRQDNIVGLYFSKYMNVPIESERLIYAEGLTDKKSVLALVGTWQIEGSLSAAFFHHPNKMKQDILSIDLQKYLQNCTLDATHQQALICR